MTGGAIKVIGITGMISSGKSTVAEMIRETCEDVIILDVDSVAKELYEKYPEIKKKLRETFGGSIFSKDNAVIYNRLAEIVFSRRSELLKLNRIMFPCLRMEVKGLLRSFSGHKYLIIDAAVLFGAKLDIICDYIIQVDSDEKTRKNFLKNKKLSDNEIELKVRGQHIEINSKSVDYLIINDGDKEKLLHETNRVMKDIESREKNLGCKGTGLD
jgi:dephospho-CoA kinase